MKQPKFVILRRADGAQLPVRVRYCRTFLCRLRGLTFRRALGPEEALLLVERRESRLDTAIHMFFVFFDIAAIWLDAQGTVVSAQLARAFRPYYVAPKPAQYVLEAAPALLEQVQVGDHFTIEPLEE